MLPFLKAVGIQMKRNAIDLLAMSIKRQAYKVNSIENNLFHYVKVVIQ